MIFRFLLFLVLFYLIFNFIRRISAAVSPSMGTNSPGQKTTGREGDVSISHKPSQKNKPNDRVGEYVDFEEVE